MRLWVAPVVAGAVVLTFAGTGEARRVPKPHPTTTTTTAPATTTTTTTALTTTTTTVPAATTTTTPATCGGPITITVGGTYSGCYESTSATPAVTVTTSSPVTLTHATIRHRGNGIEATNRPNLTVTDSTLTATNPGTPTEQLAVYLFQPATAVLDNNRLTDGHGILINGNNLTTSPLSVSRNDFVNVGRYNAPGCCIGAIHFDKVTAPGGHVDWNRAIATYGQSVNEDVIGVYQSNGAAGAPIGFAHNLIDGSYPYSGNGSGFTGSAIDLGDGGGSYLEGHQNTAINYTNVGYLIPSGNHIGHYDSTAVYDGHAGRTDTGPVVSSTFGNGISTWQNPAYPTSTDTRVINVRAGHWRLNGTWERSDLNLPECDVCSGNGSVDPVNGAAEQAAADGWESSRAAAGVTVGPRP